MSQILTLISAGESETVEFKREIEQRFDQSPVFDSTPDDLSEKLLAAYVRRVRGVSVAYFLRAMRYGEGIATMLRRCEKAGIRHPLFQEVGEDFWVTVYSREYDKFHPRITAP